MIRRNSLVLVYFLMLSYVCSYKSLNNVRFMLPIEGVNEPLDQKGRISHSFLHSVSQDIEDINSRNEYDRAIANNLGEELMVVDFQKSQCRPCQKAAPKFALLAAKYKDRIKFCSVDADKSSECLQIMKFVGVKSVPTFHLYRGGQRVDSIQGANLDDLEELIEDELRRTSH